MELVQWKESLSVNVTEIDGQHKTLVSMINYLHSSMKRGDGKLAVGEVVNGLIKYSDSHFATEERYFDQFGYPEAASHKQEHTLFSQKVLEFKPEVEKGNVVLAIQVILFLSDWLQNHIKECDKKYSQFFNAKGLS